MSESETECSHYFPNPQNLSLSRSFILDHERFRRVPDGWGYLEPFCEGRETVEEFISV